jgi:hypothetical protein
MRTMEPRTGRRVGWLSRLLTDDRGLVLGFLTRTIVLFAVIAVIGHDIGQIVWSQIQASDAAHRSAQAAANTYYQFKAETRAQQQALETVASVNTSMELKDFRVDPDGSVRTTTTEEATTFVFRHIGFLKGLTLRRASAHEERSSY